MHLLFNLPDGMTLKEFNAVLALFPQDVFCPAKPCMATLLHIYYYNTRMRIKWKAADLALSDRVDVTLPVLKALGVPPQVEAVEGNEVYDLFEIDLGKTNRLTGYSNELQIQLSAYYLQQERERGHDNTITTGQWV